METKGFYIYPFYLDRRIIDSTRLEIIFGTLSKKFKNFEEKENWMEKASKLTPNWRDHL